MNALMKLTLSVVAPLLLISCAQQALRDPGSAYYRVPEGSRITLNQPLEIRPGHARIFVQRGVAMDYSNLDQYWPSCNFEVRELKQTPQQIQPDTFTVVRVQQGRSPIVGQPRLQLAGFNIMSQLREDSGPPLVARYYDIWLASDRQPNVMRLRCFGAMADLWEAWLPRYPEIEAALGAIATIEPAR
jgi:hypothetical protein